MCHLKFFCFMFVHVTVLINQSHRIEIAKAYKAFACKHSVHLGGIVWGMCDLWITFDSAPHTHSDMSRSQLEAQHYGQAWQGSVAEDWLSYSSSAIPVVWNMTVWPEDRVYPRHRVQNECKGPWSDLVVSDTYHFQMVLWCEDKARYPYGWHLLRTEGCRINL